MKGNGAHYSQWSAFKQQLADWWTLQVLGLWGMGGIGKTTIARALYFNLQPEFEDAACFLADVRENSRDDSGIMGLQQLLLNALTGDAPIKVDSKQTGAGLLSAHPTTCRAPYAVHVRRGGSIQAPHYVRYIADDTGTAGRARAVVEASGAA